MSQERTTLPIFPNPWICCHTTKTTGDILDTCSGLSTEYTWKSHAHTFSIAAFMPWKWNGQLYHRRTQLETHLCCQYPCKGCQLQNHLPHGTGSQESYAANSLIRYLRSYSPSILPYRKKTGSSWGHRSNIINMWLSVVHLLFTCPHVLLTFFLIQPCQVVCFFSMLFLIHLLLCAALLICIKAILKRGKEQKSPHKIGIASLFSFYKGRNSKKWEF